MFLGFDIGASSVKTVQPGAARAAAFTASFARRRRLAAIAKEISQ